jgi:hypothetical protein
LKPGCVFYFPETGFVSTKAHYFIVINKEPVNPQELFLVCVSSQIEKIKSINKRSPETCLEISKVQYSEFTKDSIVDCNNVFVKSIDEIILKMEQGILKQKNNISEDIVGKLRERQY